MAKREINVAKESSLQNVKSGIDSVQILSEEIRSIIVDEVQTYLEGMKGEILSAISNNITSGSVRKIQRGSTIEAGTVTIEEVVMEKTVVLSVSKGSEGTVATNGNISMGSASLKATFNQYDYRSGSGLQPNSSNTTTISGSMEAHTGTLSGGTTDLTTGSYSAVLTSPTTLECDGPVEYQVIEYY